MKFIKGFFLFWYDFIVGDCWQIALGVVLVLGVGAWLARTEAVARETIPPMVGAGIVAVVLASLLITSKPKSKS